jgi:hypothetical protein
VFLGYGNGAFAGYLPFTSAVFYDPLQIVVGDFKGDHRLDCTIIDYFRVYVFFGSPEESYLPMTNYSTGINSSPRSITIGDLNKDNRLDIVVANSDSGNIGIFLGLGFGDFGVQTTLSTGNGSMPYSVGLGNFDDDNQLDIAVANFGNGNVGIFLGDGNGNFTRQSTYSVGLVYDPYSLVVGDVNNDTKLDIVVANFKSSNLAILFGVGDGTFVNKTIIPMGYNSWPSFVALAHINNDYLLDIAVTLYGYGTIEVISKMC